MGCQLNEAYGFRLIQCLFNKIETGTISGLQKQKAIYTWYMINLIRVGRPPLRSYLIAGMGAIRRGRACTRRENTWCNFLMTGCVPRRPPPGPPLRHPYYERDWLSNPFEGRISADEIYGCPIRKCIAVTQPNDDRYSSNARRWDA